MKLNLLPKHAGKKNRSGLAWVVTGLLSLGSIAAAIWMVTYSGGLKAQSAQVVEDHKPHYETVKKLAEQGDTIIQQARPLLLNTAFAKAALEQSAKYPELYDKVRQYIPGFYRIDDMRAVANGPGSSTVTLSGYLQTQQQYADLCLALMRIPGATSISRDGYQVVSPRVPALTEADQTGRPIRPGETPVPTDPEERLNYYIGQGSLSGFEGAGNFGDSSVTARGAMPNWSRVTVTVNLTDDLQTPDPRATLSGMSALTGAPAVAAGGAGGNAPAGGAAPGGAAPGGRGGRGARADDL